MNKPMNRGSSRWEDHRDVAYKAIAGILEALALEVAGEAMQFLALTCRQLDRFPRAEFGARAEQEAEQARTLYAQGFIRQIWYRGDVEGACILVEADSEEQVRAQLATLPLFRAGMLDVSIVPLKPYAGFGAPSEPVGGRPVLRGR